MEKDTSHCGTAAVLSFVFSGLGQLYNGQIIKGLVVIFFTSLSLFVNVLGAVLIYSWLTQQLPLKLLWTGMAVFILSLIFIGVIGIYSIVDAHKQTT